MPFINIRTAVAASLLTFSLAASAQYRLVRPDEAKQSKPKTTATDIKQASVTIKEATAKQTKNKSVRSRKVKSRPKPVLYPPIEFVSHSSEAAERPTIDLASFTGERPESKTQLIEQAPMHTLPVGTFSVTIPDCIAITEQGPEYVSGAIENLLDFDSWQFDPSYKLSTPQAYARYIEQLYGGVEHTETTGDRTVVSGYDTKSSRNYHVTMVTDGDKLHVTRIVYSPALERPVTQRIIPALTTNPTTETAL